jgi:hypothetical protein
MNGTLHRTASSCSATVAPSICSVVKRLANEVGMEAVLVSDVPSDSGNGPDYWLSATYQILVTRDRRLLESDALRYVVTPIPDRADLATFTDAHHNLFRILK